MVFWLMSYVGKCPAFSFRQDPQFASHLVLTNFYCLCMDLTSFIYLRKMGLGKTLQAITLLLARREDGPALVVTPTSVLGGWRSELKRFAPSLEVRLYHGAGREERLSSLEDYERKHVVLLTSYDTLAAYATIRE